MSDDPVSETLEQVVERLGLSVRSKFVPFSQSRNAKADAMPTERTLNWKVTLVRRIVRGDGKARFVDVLETDYQAGIGHCPSYRQGMRWTLHNSALIEAETETGFEHKPSQYEQRVSPVMVRPSRAIKPEPLGVIASLMLDCDVLDHASFEDWAGEFGYDPDSRNAEAIYQTCLAHALRINNALAHDDFRALRDAAREY